MTTMKLVTELAWGGADENETLQDVLDRVAGAAKSVKVIPLIGVTNGGWPVYEITVDESEVQNLADAMDLEVSDFHG